MLIKFALDADALTAGTASEVTHDLVEQHERFVEAWREHGVLVHRGKWNACEIRQSIDALPQSIRKIYQQMLSRNTLRMFEAPEACPSVSRCAEVHDLQPYKNVAMVVCLEDTRAAVFGLGNLTTSRCVSPEVPELVRFRSFDRLPSIKQFRMRRELPIKACDDVNKIWEERFAMLARHSRQIVVIDRYTGVNTEGSTGAWFNFLQRLDGAGGKCVVKLITSPEGRDPSVLHKSLSGFRSSRGGVQALTVYVVESKWFMGRQEGFADGAHGRLLRFDNHVILMDAGLEVFKSRRAERKYQFSVVSWQPEHEKQMKELAKRAYQPEQGG